MNERKIGQNIRNLREQAKLTLTETAKKAELTKSALSKIETGQISPPISTLIRIARSINVAVVYFFAEEQAEPIYEFTPKGKGKIITQGGTQFGYSYEALALHKRDKCAEPFLITINPGDPPGVFHHEDQEFIYILSGQMEFTIGEEKLKMKAGDSLYFDSRHAHQTRVLGKNPVKFICLFIEDKQKQR